MNAKKALRETLKNQRNRLSFLDSQKKIENNLVSFIKEREFKDVALYAAIGSEIRVLSILPRLAHINFYLPRVVGRALEFASFEKDSDLQKGAFGIMEPRAEAVPPGIIDLLILPGLGFSTKGERLGYGGGFYDRFLSTQDCFSVGICDQRFLFASLPIETHDEGMDAVLTDGEIIFLA